MLSAIAKESHFKQERHDENPKNQNKSEKPWWKYKSCRLQQISAQKSPRSQHKWQETDTVSPKERLYEGDMAPAHSWETIVSLQNDFTRADFAYTHFKLQRFTSGVMLISYKTVQTKIKKVKSKVGEHFLGGNSKFKILKLLPRPFVCF